VRRLNDHIIGLAARDLIMMTVVKLVSIRRKRLATSVSDSRKRICAHTKT
jgi:hypothetical protein